MLDSSPKSVWFSLAGSNMDSDCKESKEQINLRKTELVQRFFAWVKVSEFRLIIQISEAPKSPLVKASLRKL